MVCMNNADLLIRESDAEYRAKTGSNLTSHLLADFRKCPLLYWRKRQGLIPDVDRPAYLVGRAFHTLTLEGRNEYASRYAVGGPINEKTGKQFGPGTKAFAEWAERQNKEVLTLDQAELVERMADAIRVHEAASMLLSEGVAENVVRTEYLGLPCQIRMDWLHPEQGIADLKSADQLDYFEADARRYGYLHQMAFYRAVLAHAAGVRPTDIPVHVIAAEKAEPYRAGVWSVTNDILAICQAENEHAISRLHDAERTGIWLTGYEEIRSFNCL